MARQSGTTKKTSTILVLVGLAAVSTLAAQPMPPFATMSPAGAGVMWATQSGAPELVLTVSGPNFTMRQVSTGEAGFSMSTVRDDGSSLLDGTYNWEIRESFAGINDGVYDPANGRDGANTRPATARVELHGRVESGVFSIRNGFVVDPGLVESTAATSDSANAKEAN